MSLREYREGRRKVQFTVTVPQDLARWVEERAKAEGVFKSTVFEHALAKARFEYMKDNG